MPKAPDLCPDLVSRPVAASIRPTPLPPSFLQLDCLSLLALLAHCPRHRHRLSRPAPKISRDLVFPVAFDLHCPRPLTPRFALALDRKLFTNVWYRPSPSGHTDQATALLTLLCPQFLPLYIVSIEHREAQRMLSTHSGPVLHSTLDQHRLFLVLDRLHGRTWQGNSLRIEIVCRADVACMLQQPTLASPLATSAPRTSYSVVLFVCHGSIYGSRASNCAGISAHHVKRFGHGDLVVGTA